MGELRGESIYQAKPSLQMIHPATGWDYLSKVDHATMSMLQAQGVAAVLWAVDRSPGPSQCKSELELEIEGGLLVGWRLLLLELQCLGTKLYVCIF